MDMSFYRVQADCEELSRKVRDSGFEPDCILAVGRGGLFVAGFMSYYLGVNRIAVSSVQHYRNSEEINGEILVAPPVLLSSLNSVLVVDDVVKTWRSLTSTIEAACSQLDSGKAALKTAVLYDRSEENPDFYVEELEEWVNLPWDSLGD